MEPALQFTDCASGIGPVVMLLQHWSTAVDKLRPDAYLNVGSEFSPSAAWKYVGL